jgi:hypothetical protein
VERKLQLLKMVLAGVSVAITIHGKEMSYGGTLTAPAFTGNGIKL